MRNCGYISIAPVLISVVGTAIICGCQTRSMGTTYGGKMNPKEDLPYPLMLESAYNPLNALSTALIDGGATSARLEVSHTFAERAGENTAIEVNNVMKELRESGLAIEAKPRDNVPDGFANTTVTNTHFNEFYARLDFSDQAEIDEDIAPTENGSRPRCANTAITVAALGRIKNGPWGQTIETIKTANRSVIPYQIKIRSRYYLARDLNESGPGNLVYTVPDFFRMNVLAENKTNQMEVPLIGQNQLIKFFEIKMSTGEMPLGRNCAYLIRKHRLAQLGSEPFLPDGDRVDDVSILTSKLYVKSLSEIYTRANEESQSAQLLRSDQLTSTGENYSIGSMLSKITRISGSGLDYQAITDRYEQLRSKDPEKDISTFELFVDQQKAKRFLAERLPRAGVLSLSSSKGWLLNWRIRTLILNLYYAAALKYVGAGNKFPDDGATQFSGTHIRRPASQGLSQREIDQWFSHFKRLAALVDNWAMAVLQAQNVYFSSKDAKDMPVITTRLYDRNSWEVKALALSDKDLNANPQAEPTKQAMQMTLDSNLRISVPQAIDWSLTTNVNYPAAMRVIEFKYPVHHLVNTPPAAEKSKAFERIRKFQLEFQGRELVNSSGFSGNGKTPISPLMVDFHENFLAQFIDYLRSEEGAGCRFTIWVLRHGAQDCIVTGLRFRSAWETFINNSRILPSDRLTIDYGIPASSDSGDASSRPVVPVPALEDNSEIAMESGKLIKFRDDSDDKIEISADDWTEIISRD
jgi:hypothetical protein